MARLQAGAGWFWSKSADSLRPIRSYRTFPRLVCDAAPRIYAQMLDGSNVERNRNHPSFAFRCLFRTPRRIC
jgi:hypothetical protein